MVEPGTPYVHGWHIDAICEHLEAVTRGEIRDLLINMPPRHAKSLTVSVFWPCWEWIRRPERRWLFSSYAASLSIRDSLKCRRLIESPWYQRNWGGRYRLTSDQNAKVRFENDRTGYRLATSVGGSNTGEGADRLVADDPHNVQEAESAPIREATLLWWDEVMSTRRNDPKTGARVIVMQRTHEADLSGHVLAKGGYEHLCLPAEFEPDRRSVTSIGWTDPRTAEGELLWPDRFGRDELDALKRDMGVYAIAGQFQQRPAPRSGGMFQRGWFPIAPALPVGCRFVRYWDKAGTEGGGDYSAGVLIAKSPDGLFYIVDVARGQWSAGTREATILQTAQLDRARHGAVATWLEQEPGSSGKESAQSSVRMLAGFDAHAEPVSGDKETRARPFAAQCEAGNVRLLAGGWNAALLDELASFPTGRHDDQVDGASGAFNKLAESVEWVIA